VRAIFRLRCHETFKARSETALLLLIYLLLHRKSLNFLTCPFLASLDWWDTSHSGRGMQSFFTFRSPADGKANRKCSLCAFSALSIGDLSIGDNHRRTAFALVEHVIMRMHYQTPFHLHICVSSLSDLDMAPISRNEIESASCLTPFARNRRRYVTDICRQDVPLGLFRSDYMVHASLDLASSRPMLALKQVEFNTYSIAGGAHSNSAAEMHKSVVFSC
jgi:Eukaryotic glutathione synthase, ATP binding domain